MATKSHRASQAMKDGRFGEACMLYGELIHIAPDDPGFRLDLGLALHSAGRYREAANQFRSFLKRKPGYAPAELLLGLDYMKLDQPALAIDPLQGAVRAEPDNKTARLELAQAFLAVNRPNEALKHLLKLTENEPGSPEAWQALGLTFNALSRQAFERLENEAPESAYHLALLSRSLTERNQFLMAFSYYKKALAEKPDLRPAYEGIAELYRKTQHPDWAAVEEDREKRLPPPDCGAQKLECEFQAGHYEQVIALAHARNTPEAYYWEASAYTRLSEQAFNRLAQMPASAAIHDLMGEAYRVLGKYDLSVHEWQQALDLASDDRRQKEGLARALWLNKQYAQAESLLAELIKQEPESAQLNYELGDSALQSGQAGEAIPYLERAVKYAPDDKPAHDSLGRAYMRLGRPQKAIPHFKAAIGLDQQGTIYYQLAQAYQKSGESKLATQMMAQFQQMSKAAAARKPQQVSEYVITPP